MWGLVVAAGIEFIEKLEIAVFSTPYSCSLWEQLKTTVCLELPWAGAPCEAVDMGLMVGDGHLVWKHAVVALSMLGNDLAYLIPWRCGWNLIGRSRVG